MRRWRAWRGRRPVLAEIVVAVLLGAALALCALGSLLLQATGPVRIDGGDLLALAAAGLVAAVVVRVTVRLHRRWKDALGRLTAAAALCAVAAMAGGLIALIPGQCPGQLLSTGRCDLAQAASWGQAAGLTAVLNFLIIGLALAAYRGVRNVVRDARRQSTSAVRSLRDMRRPRAGAEASRRKRSAGRA